MASHNRTPPCQEIAILVHDHYRDAVEHLERAKKLLKVAAFLGMRSDELDPKRALVVVTEEMNSCYLDGANWEGDGDFSPQIEKLTNARNDGKFVDEDVMEILNILESYPKSK